MENKITSKTNLITYLPLILKSLFYLIKIIHLIINN